MSKSYANIHLLLHDIYLNKVTKIAPYAKQLEGSARSMLDKAKLASNLERAKSLRALLDKHMAKGEKDDEHVEEIFLIHRLLNECFEVITDDLMLLSAFEMYTKGKLLRKGYLVHEVRKPNKMYKRQKKSPVHVRTVRALDRKGEHIEFSEKTIGIGQLLEQGYICKFPLGQSVLKGLSEVRKRRNLVHFQMGMAWSITQELIDFVEYLESVVPAHENGRRKQS